MAARQLGRITIGPILMTLGLTALNTWRFGYQVVGIFQISLAVCFVLTLAMWSQNNVSSSGEAEKRLTDYQTPMRETLRQPHVWLSVVLFFLYVGALLGAHLLIWNPSEIANVVVVGVIGLSIAPIFPAMMSGTRTRVGDHHAANTIGMQMTATGLGTAVIAIGFPSFVKSFSASIVVIITNNLLKQIGGDSALSVFAIVNRLYSSLNTPQIGMVQGMQPIVGYNFGQKKIDRVRKTITYSLRSSAIYGLLTGSLCLLIPATLITLLSKESEIIADGQVALRIMAFACPLGGISVMVAAYFQSTGRAKEALIITLGGIILVKLPVLLLASSLFSLKGIWASEAISESILCSISLLMLRSYQGKITATEFLAYSS